MFASEAASFYDEKLQHLVPRSDKYLKNGGNYVDKSLNNSRNYVNKYNKNGRNYVDKCHNNERKYVKKVASCLRNDDNNND